MHNTIEVKANCRRCLFEILTLLKLTTLFLYEGGLCMEIKVAIGLIVLSCLCFFSSYYRNGNGQLGYKGILFLLSNEKERSFVYKYSNRCFGIALFIGSIIFLLLFSLIANQKINSDYLQNVRKAYIIYSLCSMLISELFVLYKKRQRIRG